MNLKEFSSRGGKARARAMSAKERKRIATAAANKRWKTKRVTRCAPNHTTKKGTA